MSGLRICCCHKITFHPDDIIIVEWVNEWGMSERRMMFVGSAQVSSTLRVFTWNEPPSALMRSQESAVVRWCHVKHRLDAGQTQNGSCEGLVMMLGRENERKKTGRSILSCSLWEDNWCYHRKTFNRWLNKNKTDMWICSLRNNSLQAHFKDALVSNKLSDNAKIRVDFPADKIIVFCLSDKYSIH